MIELVASQSLAPGKISLSTPPASRPCLGRARNPPAGSGQGPECVHAAPESLVIEIRC